MGRKRGSRFRKAIDAEEQLEEIEAAQRDSRKKHSGKLIASTEKSRFRFRNSLAAIRKPRDARREYEP